LKIIKLQINQTTHNILYLMFTLVAPHKRSVVSKYRNASRITRTRLQYVIPCVIMTLYIIWQVEVGACEVAFCCSSVVSNPTTGPAIAAQCWNRRRCVRILLYTMKNGRTIHVSRFVVVYCFNTCRHTQAKSVVFKYRNVLIEYGGDL